MKPSPLLEEYNNIQAEISQVMIHHEYLSKEGKKEIIELLEKRLAQILEKLES